MPTKIPEGLRHRMKSKSDDPQEVESTFEGWKIVPVRSRKLTCGICRTKMKSGMKGWHHAYSDGDSYWWCERCMTDDDHIVPGVTTCYTVEELKAAWLVNPLRKPKNL